jgi:glyoxylase-like metal-dependent hydrolase (beta-lactamase superfamily II)
MIREWVLPGLLETGPVESRIMAIQDGLVNFYVARGPEGLVCVDAGWRPHCVEHGFKKMGLDMRDVAAVFLSHTHWDHARCADLYPNAQVFMGGGEVTGSSRARVQDKQLVTAAGLAVRVIETPGHTPDSVCYLVDGRFLFTGDALRLRRGRVVPFPSKFNHDQAAAKASLGKLARIQGIECLLTGHSGATRDVEAAFRDWRESDPDAGSGETGSP